MSEQVVAIDLGGTNIRAALVQHDGTVVKRIRRPTPTQDPEPTALLEMVEEVSQGSDVDKAVIGLPGVIDHECEELVAAPNLPPSWIPLLSDAWLTRRTGLGVSLANDADLAAVGESFLGAGQPFRDVVYVTISTGVGAGIVLGNRLMRGRYSGGEIGHTVIDRQMALAGADGTVEGLGSGTAMAAALAEAGLDLSGPEVSEAVRSGDPQATSIFSAAISAAGLGVVNLCWLVSPQVVVIGGGLGSNDDLVLPILRRLIDHSGPKIGAIELVAAGLGDDAGLVGAAGWWEAVGRTD